MVNRTIIGELHHVLWTGDWEGSATLASFLELWVLSSLFVFQRGGLYQEESVRKPLQGEMTWNWQQRELDQSPTA